MVIDVSIHNGAIDWSRVKESGVEGAIIRVGYGRDLTKQDDARFRENIEGAIANGLRVGAYIYSYAKDEEGARSEAAHILRLVEPYKANITLPLYLDLEESKTERGAKERAVVFGDIIEAAGYWCGIYASEYWFKTHLNGLNRFTKWVASWGSNNGAPNTKPSIEGSFDLWQYTSKGKISGIRGDVDLSELLRAEIKGYVGTGEPAPSPTPVKPEPIAAPSYIEYKIKKGDTLSKIAKAYGVSVQAIKEANPDKIKNVNKIYAGDVIRIPR